jgi:cytochrome b involved in lipid metabolism
MCLPQRCCAAEGCVRGAAQVYDATPFLKAHPGGGDSILIVAGTDATEEFNAIHSSKAKAQLLEYCIGDLADENVACALPPLWRRLCAYGRQ